MKKLIIPIGVLLVTGHIKAQVTPLPNTENYVQTKTYLDYTGTQATKSSETVQYFDGLGRAKQTINIKGSPQGKDVVSHIEYDAFGRQVKDYLPVPQSGTQNGAIYTSPLGNAPSVYGSEKIFSEKILENSPLDRIQQQIQVGNDWSAKPVSFGYAANVAGEVYQYVTSTTWENGATKSVLSLAPNTTYGANQLYKNTIKDEDGNETIEFKNGQGQVLLVRKVLSSSVHADTYYVYNEYNQLAFVLSPNAVHKPINDDLLNNFCYQYRYDGKGRMVEKRLPGKGWEYMVYDKADRLVLTQDANLRSQGKWMFTKYDQLSRPIYTGILDSPPGRVQQVAAVEGAGANTETRSTSSWNNSGMDVFYTNTGAYPTTNFKLTSINYYDTYPGYTFNPAFPASILGEPTLTETPSSEGRSLKGLPVMGGIKNVEDDNWTKTYTYYDTKGRIVGTHSINHLGGYTRVESQLDFSGAPKKTVTRHLRLATEAGVTISERFVYDSQNRLKEHWHQVDSKPEQLLAQNTYNELSQLSNKKVGNNLQSIDYAYNIRGWMTDINKDQMGASDLGGKLFSYKIKYTQKDGITNPDTALFPGKDVKARYNGNIAEVDWRAVESLGANPSLTPKRYGYAYDALNRLTAGYYQNPNNSYSKEHTESLAYDLNGNITGLYRTTAIENNNTTATAIDNLEYTYTKGNQVSNIKDHMNNPSGYEGGNGTIEYDLNGNMWKMPDKNISNIKYNYLNLPSRIEYGDLGSLATNNYLFRGDGVKLQKIIPRFECGIINCYTVNSISDYLDGFQYFREQMENGGGTPGGPVESLRMHTEKLKHAQEQQAFTLERPEMELFPDSDGKVGGGNQTAKIFRTQGLIFFPTAEGFYDYTKDQYIYQYKDHLGNVRISFTRNSAGALEITDANDYYPFGMNHLKTGNSFYGEASYKNYKYQGQELQETGWYSFKWRNYMPDVGRFFNIDPLSEKYAYQSHYNFSENKVTSHRELEGLEAVPADNFNKNQSTLVVLGLGRADGRNGDGVGSGTNTLYSNLPKNLQTDGALASLQNNLGGNIAVAAYTGTDSGLAATHMTQTISNYRSVNPDGNVIMIGHSLGGKDILNAASSTTENINLVLTMEPVSVNAGGGTAYSSDPYSASLGGNVQNIISLSADKNMFSGGGGSKTVTGQTSIKATMTGTGHTNIDDSMTPYLKPLIQRTDQGVNPVKWFQNVNWNNFQVQPNVRTGNQEKKGTGSGS